MSLLTLPNEILINYVFAYCDIEISDLYHLMHSCSRLNIIIRNSNRLWKEKYEERWGELESYENIPRNDIIWLPLVEKRLNVAKGVKETVEALSSICYPERFETVTPQCVADKLILCPDDPLFKFVEEELHQLAFMSLWNLDSSETLTIAYYAECALKKVRTRMLEGKWWNYLEQPEEQKSLLEGVILTSQWLEVSEEFLTSSLDVRNTLEKISQRVKHVMKENKKSSQQALRFNADFSGNTSSRDILNVINQVLFLESERDFMDTLWLHEDPDFNERIKNISITQVVQRREGCTTILAIIYQELAKSMGVHCELVYCDSFNDDDDRLLIRWREFPEKEDPNCFSFIDVCDRGSFHRLDPSRRIGPLRCQYHDEPRFFTTEVCQPPETIEYILQRMVEPYLREGQAKLWIFGPSGTLTLVTRLSRLACIISSLIGEAPDLVEDYARHCWEYGVQLDDAINLLQAEGLDESPLLAKCLIQVAEHQNKIDKKAVCRRVPSIKYAVGLVMMHCFQNIMGQMCNELCVITSWDVKGVEETYNGHVENFDQPFYSVLTMSNSDTTIYVAEESLTPYPNVGSIFFHHDQIGLHFERFDGRRYVPNAEKRRHFPDDEAVALSLTNNLIIQ